MTPPVVLTIAGTDSGGAAGIAADLTTFAALGVHGACAVTAVTAQDTTAVHRVVPLAADDVAAQVAAVLDDLPVAAVKTGLLGSADVARLVAGLSLPVPLVVDPVFAATSGAPFADDALVRAYREDLLPAATVVTPNRAEAVRLAGADPATPPARLAEALHALGPAVVLTGGDDGSPGSATCTDLLAAGGRVTSLEHPAVASRNDHGTGCTFSAALAAVLATGRPLEPAVRAAQAFVVRALRTSAPWTLGRSRGPVAHTAPRTTLEAH